MRDGFVLGLVLGAAVMAVVFPILLLSSIAFGARVRSIGRRFWVRGDAGFQAWLRQTADRSVFYARQLLLVLTDERLELYVPHRTQPVWSSDYRAIRRITTEAFQSRSFGNTRGVRIEFEGLASVAIRPEVLWMPARFAPPSLVEDLARELAERARLAESARRSEGS